jgi:hypothetical protein
MGARRDQRSHPSAPLYYPGNASVQQAEQLSGSLQFTFSQILGEIADAQVPESAVTQHEAALSLTFPQLTDTIGDAQVPASAVTQHADQIALDDLMDVNAPTPADGDLLAWDDGAGEWVPLTPAGGAPHDLDSHTDVNAPTPADGDVLTWDDTAGEWVAAAPSGGGAHDLDSHTDVNAPTPADREVLIWDSTPGEWVADALTVADVSGAQATLARGDEVITTASLAVDAEETGTVALGKSGLILNVAADRACWVRFYGTAAERTADAARLITEDPDDDVPVLADLIFSASLLTIPTAPLIGYTNRDGSPATTIYYSIINKSAGTSTVEVTVTRLNLET